MNQIEFQEFSDASIRLSHESSVWLQARYQSWVGDTERQMRWLMEDIAEDLRGIRYMTGRPVPGKKVLDTMLRVQRQEFVPFELKRSAYANCALPIGYGQCLDQPNLVALMTDLVNPQPEAVVLEIGTGSGYQSALLAELVGRVYTLEILEPLSLQARHRLHRLGYDNIEVRTGNGCHGWPEKMYFDGIIVTASAHHVPGALVDQLKPGGTLLIPITAFHAGQELLEIHKDAQGKITENAILPVSFPALMGEDCN